MAASQTKKLKTEIKAAVRAVFSDRGWTPKRSDSQAFVAPETVVRSPLSLEWSTEIDSYRYGGATLTGLGAIRSESVAGVLIGFDPGTLTPLVQRLDDRARVLRTLGEVAATSQGHLVDPLGNFHQWIVDDTHPVDLVASEFAAMVDGPLASWAAANGTAGDVLSHYGSPDERTSTDALRVRSLSVLALLEGNVEVARMLVSGAPVGHGEDPQAVIGFERELARRFPEYGPLQRS